MCKDLSSFVWTNDCCIYGRERVDEYRAVGVEYWLCV